MEESTRNALRERQKQLSDQFDELVAQRDRINVRLNELHGAWAFVEDLLKPVDADPASTIEVKEKVSQENASKPK